MNRFSIFILHFSFPKVCRPQTVSKRVIKPLYQTVKPLYQMIKPLYCPLASCAAIRVFCRQNFIRMSKKDTVKGAAKEATPAEKKHAEWLYVERNLSLQAVADELGRNVKTIYEWRDKGDWEETRNLFAAGPSQLRKILIREATRIAKGEVRRDQDGNEVDGIDADSLSKVMKAYDYMCQKLSVEVFRDAFVEFDNWMTSIDPKLAYEFTKYHKMFLQDKISLEV